MYTLMNNDRNILGVTILYYSRWLVFNSVFTSSSYSSSYTIKNKLTTEAPVYSNKQKTVCYLCQQVVEQKLWSRFRKPYLRAISVLTV